MKTTVYTEPTPEELIKVRGLVLLTKPAETVRSYVGGYYNLRKPYNATLSFRRRPSLPIGG